MFRLFSKSKKDWQSVYSTKDAWEAELVRSALLNENIHATVESIKYIEETSGRKERRNVVRVPDSRLAEARMIIQRASIVISNKDNIIAEQERLAAQMEDEKNEPIEIDEIEPIGEAVLLAEKDGIGKIFYYEANDVYELRLEMEFYKNSHFMNGEDWDEFINFSAQRQEFFILMKEKYPKLAALLKEHKMRPNFLKLIEYSYGKSQPPRGN